MRFDDLDDWLSWQETLHPSRIELRLERVGAVWAALGPEHFPCPVITVGGTNGKGSCVAYLESFYRAGGYRCGAYTSPHLLHYSERVRIDGAPVGSGDLCAAFARIDVVRGETPLTYFEFGTLAALDLFARARLDIVILEVGLGGRLDAVNILDADVAVVTSIGLDHTAWLGDDPAGIAEEKAGIFRAGRPAVIGSQDTPARLRARAEEIGARPFELGREHGWHKEPAGHWAWWGVEGARREALPAPAMRGPRQYDNAAAAICAAQCLHQRLPLSTGAIRQGLQRTRLAGRFQVIPGAVTWVLDVAHNPEAAAVLAENLALLGCDGRRHAVMALLADKDAAGVVTPLAPLIDCWHLAPAPSDRAMALSDLEAAVALASPSVASTSSTTVDQALASAGAVANEGDLILVFGSFVTVEAALRSLQIATV
jgi:dihydrofolate synthase/folylpolyglutamate synthase